MAPVTIRPVTPTDFEAWRVLWEAYNAFYGRAGDTALPGAITDTTWSRFLDDSEPMHALVADREGELLGLTHYLFHRSTILIHPTCYLQDLYTSAAARGRGVARALITEVYRHAEAAGSQRVYWQTHETNTTAMHLYDKVAAKSGFVVYRKML